MRLTVNVTNRRLAVSKANPNIHRMKIKPSTISRTPRFPRFFVASHTYRDDRACVCIPTEDRGNESGRHTISRIRWFLRSLVASRTYPDNRACVCIPTEDRGNESGQYTISRIRWFPRSSVGTQTYRANRTYVYVPSGEGEQPIFVSDVWAT